MHFFCDLSLSSVLSGNLIKFTLFASFFLLLLNHHFNIVSLIFFLSSLHLKSLSGLCLFILCFHSTSIDLVLIRCSGLFDHLLLCFFYSAIHFCTHSYVHLLLLFLSLSGHIQLDIPLALGNDLICTFPCFVNLLSHLVII